MFAAVCRTGCNALGGYCNNPGKCLCRAGYSGTNCNTVQCLSGCATCNTPTSCLTCRTGWNGPTCTVPTYCINNQFGGMWALVRHVPQGSTWFPDTFAWPALRHQKHDSLQ